MRCSVRRSVAQLLSLIILAACGRNAVGTAVTRFVAEPSLSAWAHLEDRIGSETPTTATQKFYYVLEYHAARERRDLPNSMALTELSPGEFVDARIKQLAKLEEKLKKSADQDMWQLLHAMASQSFDDGLTWTSSEIAWKVSRSQFDKMEVNARSVSEEAREIFRRTRERWGAQQRSQR